MEHVVMPYMLEQDEMKRLLGLQHSVFQPLPDEESWYEVPEPGQILIDKEPVLRLTRPLIDAARTTAIAMGIDWVLDDVAVGEYKALPPSILYELAVEDGRHEEGYTRDAQGVPELRDILSDWTSELTGYRFTRANNRITMGGLGAYEDFLMFMIPRNSRILAFEPSWPNGKTGAEAMGHKVHSHRLDPAEGYRLPDLKTLMSLYSPRQFDVVLLEKPGNPTGIGWYDTDEMETFAAFVQYMQAIGGVDEEYEYLYQREPGPDGKRLQARTILEVAPKGIARWKGLTKFFSATSNRIGELSSADPKMTRLFGPISKYRLSSPNWMRHQLHLAQAIGNLTHKGALAYLLGLNDEIHINRGVVIEELKGGPGTFYPGFAAFYGTWVVPELRPGGAMQCLLWNPVQDCQAIREGRQPEGYANIIPLPGFIHNKESKPEGYRFSLTDPRNMVRAARRSRQQVSNYINARQPYMGEPGEITSLFLNGGGKTLQEKFVNGAVINPRPWPEALRPQSNGYDGLAR